MYGEEDDKNEQAKAVYLGCVILICLVVFVVAAIAVLIIFTNI